MVSDLFFTILRSVAIPYVAFILLKGTALGEQGSLLAVGIALTIVNIFSVIFNIIKIIPNTLLLRGNAVLGIILRIIIQLGSVLVIWYYYLSKFTTVLK